MSAKVSRSLYTVEVTPTLDTGAHQADDMLTDVMTIDTGIANDGASSGYILQSLTVTDAAKQQINLVVFFFDESPTVASSKNAALDITDAEIADKCIGFTSITAYEDLSANAVGCASNIGLALKVKTGGGNGKIYAVAKTLGTPTYAASSLTFKFNLIAEH